VFHLGPLDCTVSPLVFDSRFAFAGCGVPRSICPGPLFDQFLFLFYVVPKNIVKVSALPRPAQAVVLTRISEFFFSMVW